MEQLKLKSVDILRHQRGLRETAKEMRAKITNNKRVHGEQYLGLESDTHELKIIDSAISILSL